MRLGPTMLLLVTALGAEENCRNMEKEALEAA